jgi:lysozyme
MPHVNNPKTAAAMYIAAALAIAVPVVGNFEGFASKPYVDTVGTGHPETWCYGETAADGGKVPAYGTLFTKAECQASLQEKLAKVYDPMVRACIDAKYLDGFPSREASLISFVYNGGQGWLCNPAKHTYTAVASNINAGNITAGCNDMKAYNRASGIVLSGLVTRRAKEAALCIKGVQ